MICPNCNTPNEKANVYCISCGTPLMPGGGAGPTVSGNRQYENGSSVSEETLVLNQADRARQEPPPTYVYPQQPAPAPTPVKSSNMPLFAALGVLAVLLLGGGAYLVISKMGPTEKLPDHLGLFAQSADKQNLNEVAKHDVTNALQARTDLLKNETLPTLEESPNLIFYSDGKSSINDLRLVQLDTIKDDGTLQQLDFQAAPLDWKPEINRLRVPSAMANGKYAFVMLDGFLNEGKHKFWAFQVKNSSKSSNGDALKTTTVSLKPTPTPAPKQQAPQGGTLPVPVLPKPPGNTVTSNTTFLILRAGPSQSSAKIRNLARGETVEVLGYSSNTETFKGQTSTFTQVRTADGTVGWAFTAFLR